MQKKDTSRLVLIVHVQLNYQLHEDIRNYRKAMN